MASTPANNKSGPAPVRLALVGLGRWGRVLAGAVRAAPDVHLARVASRNPDAAALAGLDCPVDADWRTTVAAPDIDGVIIATPPATHAAIAQAAMDAGRALFIEKPLTLDPAEAEDLLEQAERADAVVFVDHVHLFHPAYRRLKASVADAGGPRALRLVNGNAGPDRDETPPFWDWGAHEAALALDLMGADPETAGAFPQDETGRMVSLSFSFPAGRTATARIGTGFDKRCRMMAVATQAETWIHDEQAPHVLARRPGCDLATVVPGETPSDARPVAVDALSPLDCAFSEFAAAVRAGGPHLEGLRLGVRVIRLLSRLENG